MREFGFVCVRERKERRIFNITVDALLLSRLGIVVEEVTEFFGVVPAQERSCPIMAARCHSLARRTAPLAWNVGMRRHCHSRSLWEDLLGRKIEASAAQKLEEAFLEYRVRKAVPSWLPFLPNSSFWIPSTEDTMKNLEVLAKRMKLTRRPRNERVSIIKAPPDWSDQGTVSTAGTWSAIQETDQLLSLGNSARGLLKDKGTLIEIELEDEDEDEDDDDDDIDDEDELEIIERQKP